MKLKNYDAIIIFLVTLFVFLFKLGAGSLSSWDEAFYAQVSREMFNSGNWVDLTWGGARWSDKPPLYMWATAFFYGIFGVKEFSVRLFSALCGSGTVVLTYFFALKLFDRKTGIIAALMLASTFHFLWLSKLGNLDTAFTFFAWGGAVLFALSGKKRVLFFMSAVSFALAFLTKGSAALIAVLAVSVYSMTDRSSLEGKRQYTLPAAAIFLLIVSAWYVPAYLHYGGDFLKGQFGEHLLMRTSTAMDGHTGTWLTYINVILYKGKIWGTAGLVFLPVFAFMIYRGIIPAKAALPVAWSAVFILVFTCVSTKLHWYIIPVYPALCVIAAYAGGKLAGKSAVLVFTIAAAASIAYFGVDKGVFFQDNNPAAKAFSREVFSGLKNGEELYVYGVSDPGLKFYLGAGKTVLSEKELSDVSEKKGAVLAAPIKYPGLTGRRIRLSDPATGYAVFSTEP